MELQDILDKIDRNELDQMSREDLLIALDVVKKAGKKTESEIIASFLFDKNITSLNSRAQRFGPDNTANVILDNMMIESESGRTAVDENGDPINLKQEIIETAQLIVLDGNVENGQELTQKEYDEKVNKTIHQLVASMIAAEKDGDKIDVSKPFTISPLSAGQAFARPLEEIKARAQQLSETYKFSKQKYAAQIKERVGSLDAKLTEKLGKFYTAPRDMIHTMIKNGTWKSAVVGGALGGAAMFATSTVMVGAASVGLAVYSGVIGYHRSAQFIKAMYAEKKAVEADGQKFSYKQYYKEHKGDARRAALYAVAGVAGVLGGITSGVTAYMSAADAAAKGAAISSTWFNSATGVTRVGATWGATNAANLSVALDFKKASKKERYEAWKHIGTNTAIMAGIMLVGSAVSHDAHAAEPTDPNIMPVDSLDADSTQVTQPVAEGGDTGDTGGTSDGQGQDAATTGTMEKIEIGDREQAWYEKNLRECVKPQHINGHWYPPQLSQDTVDIILANIEGGIVTLPDGMSPEMAINMARIEALNYGKPELLEWLSGCNVKINGTQELYDLTKVTYTKFDGVHWLGDHIDFQGDMNRHGSADIHCGNSHIHGYGSHHAPAPQPEPAAPAPVEEPVDELVVDYPAQPEPEPAPEVVIHTDGGQDTVEQLTAGNPDDVKIKLPAEEVVVHADGNGDVVNQLTGGNPEPVRVKLTPELMNAINSGNQR